MSEASRVLALLLAQDESLADEVATFTPKALDYCLATFEALLEDGSVPRQAARDAVAAILQHKRLLRPSLSDAQLRSALFWEKEYAKSRSPEEAEFDAYARVLQCGVK